MDENQATISIKAYRLLRVINLSTLHCNFDRVYFEIRDEELNVFGWSNGAFTYCSFGEQFIQDLSLNKKEPVGVIVDSKAWQDTASRLNNSRSKPRTVRDHKPIYSDGLAPDSDEMDLFVDQYKDDAGLCVIEFDCEQGSYVACQRRIIARRMYEEPLPTPRLTLIHWEQLYHLMSQFGIDSIDVNGTKIENRFTQVSRDHQSMLTHIWPTPKNNRGYGNRNLFYSDKVSRKEITMALWGEIKHKVRRKSIPWLHNAISVPDSEITFETSTLRRIDNLFDNDDRFLHPSDYSAVRSRIHTKIEHIEELTDFYDDYLSPPPYPVESKNGEFVLAPELPLAGSKELDSRRIEGQPIRKEVRELDSVVNTLSGEVTLESDPDLDMVAVVQRSNDMTLRFIFSSVG